MGWLSLVDPYALWCSRVARGGYRYLTGDRSRLGFCRTVYLFVVVLDVVKMVLTAQDHQWFSFGTFAGITGGTVLFGGPFMFRAAAETDARPEFPSILSVNEMFMAVVRGMSLAVAYDVIWLLLDRDANAVLRLGWDTILLAMWAAMDPEGGGSRTLAGDVRGLFGRRPSLAAGTSS